MGGGSTTARPLGWETGLARKTRNKYPSKKNQSCRGRKTKNGLRRGRGGNGCAIAVLHLWLTTGGGGRGALVGGLNKKSEKRETKRQQKGGNVGAGKGPGGDRASQRDEKNWHSGALGRQTRGQRDDGGGPYCEGSNEGKRRGTEQ